MGKKRWMICFLALSLLLTACADQEVKSNKTSIKDGTNITSKETAEKNAGGEAGTNEGVPRQNDDVVMPMSDFFLKDGTKAHFKGEGNEFAGFTMEITQPYENFFIVYENNGGIFLRRIFSATEKQIYILDESTVDYKDEFPSLAELEDMTPKGIYLQKPLKVGATFDLWTVVDIDATVETPYRTFTNAIVIEQKEEHVTNRKYFVQDFGEVKRESIQTTNGKEFVVTSELESVSK